MNACFETDDVVRAIREHLAVESHLKFVEELTNQHNEKLQNTQQLLTIIEKIRKRESDPRLYLGTVWIGNTFLDKFSEE